MHTMGTLHRDEETEPHSGILPREYVKPSASENVT